MSLPTVLAVAGSLCTALLLAAICWQRRATLALICAIAGSVLTLAALGLQSSRALLAGSLGASAIGAGLLALGLLVEHLLDKQPEQGA